MTQIAAVESLPTWPPGDGAMAARVRAHDWAGTPLGPVDDWPAALRTAVQVCLDAPLPTLVLWGDELTMIPNDALVGTAADGGVALGEPFREAQPEAWAAESSRLARLLETGEAQTVPGLWRVAGAAAGVGVGAGAGAGTSAQSPAAPPTFACTALRDEHGEVAGLIASGVTPPARDVLERLVHELRGPLAPIRSSLELLRMSRDGLEVALVHEMLERQIHAMVQVIDGLLDEPPGSGMPAEAPRAAAGSGTGAGAGGAGAARASRDAGVGAGATAQVRAGASAASGPSLGSPAPVAEPESSEAGPGAGGAPGGVDRRRPRPAGSPPEVPMVGWTRRRRLAERPPEPVEPDEDSPPIARRVLVVDDHHDAADSLALLLSHLGTEVKVAYDGATALEALDEWMPEAVLLDLEMPGMDGFEVARRIRGMPRLYGLPLIALSGLGQGTDMQRTRAAGIDHHLVKPVRLDVLVEVLASLDGLADDVDDETWH